jgi:hypothetical protein
LSGANIGLSIVCSFARLTALFEIVNFILHFAISWHFKTKFRYLFFSHDMIENSFGLRGVIVRDHFSEISMLSDLREMEKVLHVFFLSAAIFLFNPVSEKKSPEL